jgi:hypothetical protein
MDHCSAAAFHEPHSVKQSAALNFWFVLFQDKMNRDVTEGNDFYSILIPVAPFLISIAGILPTQNNMNPENLWFSKALFKLLSYQFENKSDQNDNFLNRISRIRKRGPLCMFSWDSEICTVDQVWFLKTE